MTGPSDDDELGLRDAAAQLDVHYMTAYRYVRSGRLSAHKVGAEWRVRLGDLRALMAPAPAVASTKVPRHVFRERIEDRLVAADEAGVWGIVESALVSGADPDEVLLDVISPAMVSIGARWEMGQLSVAEEHQASAVAGRVVARLGPRFSTRGRKRAEVVIGGVPGERHALPTAIAADVLRGARYDVVDLGADTPIESFVEAALARTRLVAVLLSVTSSSNLEAVAPTIQAVREEVPGVAVIVGGQAVDRATAASLGSDGWAGNARDLVDLLEHLASERRGGGGRDPLDASVGLADAPL